MRVVRFGQRCARRIERGEAADAAANDDAIEEFTGVVGVGEGFFVDAVAGLWPAARTSQVLPFEVAYSPAPPKHSIGGGRGIGLGLRCEQPRGEAAPRSAAPRRGALLKKIAASDGGIHAEGMVADLVFVRGHGGRSTIAFVSSGVFGLFVEFVLKFEAGVVGLLARSASTMS